MKKLLVLALVLGLMVVVSASALAAVHGIFDDFANPLGNDQFSGLSWGGWYSIDKDSPYMTARVRSSEDFTSFGFEYYQNDFFHANVSYINDTTTPWDYKVTALKGSYLFDFGMFVGLDYASVDDDFWFSDTYNQTIISPGFRWELGDGGYAAISVDYSASDEGWFDTGILGYELAAKYFTDNAKIYGAVYIPNDDVAGEDETQFGLAANYKFNDVVTVGAAYNGNVGFGDYDEYNLGATFSLDKLMLELSYTDNTDDSNPAAAVNGIYSFTDKFKAGLQYTKVDSYDDGAVDLKFHYSLSDKSNIRLIYRFENDSYDSVIFLRWTKDL